MITHKYYKYTPQFKHNVLEEYRPGVIGCGFKSLAKRFKVKGGHKQIMGWYKRWDGTIDSLNPKPRGHRPRTMTTQEVKQYILKFVESMNRKRVQVNYKLVQAHIESQLNIKVSLRTIRRYGKSCGLKWRKTRQMTSRDDDDDYWTTISQFRKSLREIHKDQLIFIDEVAIYSTMVPRRTLVAPGQQPLILVQEPSVYAKRFDFIGAVNGSQPIACGTFTPEDRVSLRVKAPSINRLRIKNLYLICDKSSSHNQVNMMQALRAGKCYCIKKILHMPTGSAKYLSPLDNPLWHSFKETIRNKHPLILIDIPALLSQTFYSLSTSQIQNAYRKCGYEYGIDDCYDRP